MIVFKAVFANPHCCPQSLTTIQVDFVEMTTFDDVWRWYMDNYYLLSWYYTNYESRKWRHL